MMFGNTSGLRFGSKSHGLVVLGDQVPQRIQAFEDAVTADPPASAAHEKSGCSGSSLPTVIGGAPP